MIDIAKVWLLVLVELSFKVAVLGKDFIVGFSRFVTAASAAGVRRVGGRSVHVD